MPAVTLINTIPRFVSQDEYKNLATSTPNSFNDIPPVVRHKEDNVSLTLEPAVGGFSEADGASGSLYVLTSVLVFMSNTGRGFQIEYPSITLHAISRSDSRPSIYCQLDESGGLEDNNTSQATTNGVKGDEEEEPEPESYTDVRELNIIPPSPDSLEPIFEALSQCASLHPDKHSDDEDFDDAVFDGGIDSSPFEVFTGDNDQELSEVGRAALAHLESIIYDPTAEDAEDEVDRAGQDGGKFQDDSNKTEIKEETI